MSIEQEPAPSGRDRSETATTQPPSEREARTDSRNDTRPTDIDTPETTYTARFAGFVGLFGLLVGLGLVTLHPAAFAAAVIPLAFLLAGLVGQPAVPAAHLRSSYEVSPANPRPGESVAVTVTVENTGEATFTDLRLVDTVPDTLRVVEGTPRAGGVLRPGESLTAEYEVIARRGEHTFGPVVARSRTLVGAIWAQQSVPADRPAFRCAVRADDIPLAEQASHFIGDLLSETGGEGIEFYATREYRRGDPASRIHWRELAKRGELSTITYRERQAANVTLITDARDPARVGYAPGDPSGAVLAAYATARLVRTLVARNHYVGVTAPGLEPVTDQQFPYRRIDYGRGTEQRRLTLDLLDAVDVSADASAPSTLAARPTASGPTLRTESDEGDWLDTYSSVTIEGFVQSLRRWGSRTTQYICVTPLLDGSVTALCRRLDREGYPVVVISPDVTTPLAGDAGDTTVPERTVRLQRAARIESLRKQGVTVIDWHPARSLAACCENQTLPGA
jgi:uncharacterized repeat protein (TIGR01451 family)